MNWHEVRSIYPNRWVLLEAIESHHQGDKWHPDQLTIINEFVDITSALSVRRQLRSQMPKRDLFIAHTNNLVLDIQERQWIGVGFMT
ncbi:hypothetical protein TI05_07670 [Achromatium sp. WMS3]|nr:hypothetical protein TI05_07670 [Achromatium sp. WMS3]